MNRFPRPTLVRLAVSPAIALLLVPLAAAIHAPKAQAAIVPNPHPELIALWEPCEPGTGVTVIVDRQDRLGDGKVHVRCALGAQPDGWTALQEAGFDVEGLFGGTGFVCRIDGLPTPDEEPCELTPGGDRYWSYWHGKPGGRWGYSGVGATSPLSAAPIDAVQAWSFGGAPRVLPMHGAGPSAFVLPPAQESSAAPKALARDWLADVIAETGAKAQAGELQPVGDATWGPGLLELLALEQAGVDPAAVAPFAEWMTGFDGQVGLQWASTALLANPPIEPTDPEYWTYWNLDRLPMVALGIDAAGQDPTDFAGHDLRAYMLHTIDPATGKLRTHTTPGSIFRQFAGEWVVDGEGDFGAFFPQSAFAYAGLLRALLHTGGLPDGGAATVQHFLAKQDPSTGAFGGSPELEMWSIWALVELRKAGVEGVTEPLERAATFLESLQEEDGGVRQRADADVLYRPNAQSTAFGAAGLALAGRRVAAERAAKWVSRYQVTAEYAGSPAPGSDDFPPAFDAIGAFLPNEDALRNALAFGVGSDEFGLFNEARQPTAAALLAFALAGPYGPYATALDQQSLWFDSQAVGSDGPVKTATLTNHDERTIAVAGAHPAGEQSGDFDVDAADCVGKPLASGESCELSATFEPTAPGARQAILHLPLAGTAQTVVVALGGTAVAATVDPGPPARPGPAPGPDPDPQPAPNPQKASIASFAKAQRVNTRRIARVARLTCPEGEPCRVIAPRRTWVKIAGRRYTSIVLAPRRVDAGQRAALRVRVPKAAVERLRDRRATATLKVGITYRSELTIRTVRTTIVM
jgi:hypothetical protein